MTFFVNGNETDITLENEKTIGDVLNAFEVECENHEATIISITIDGQQIPAHMIDGQFKTPLDTVHTIEVNTVSVQDLKQAFAKITEESSALAEKLENIPVELQKGNDTVAARTFSAFADFFDFFCRTVTLSALFPTVFQNLQAGDENVHHFLDSCAPILTDLQNAMEQKDTVLTGDLAEYELAPRMRNISEMAATAAGNKV